MRVSVAKKRLEELSHFQIDRITELLNEGHSAYSVYYETGWPIRLINAVKQVKDIS